MSGPSSKYTPQTTPQSLKTSSFGLDRPKAKAKEVYLQMDIQTRDHWIGPFPLTEFMDEFLPWPRGQEPVAPAPMNYFSSIPDTGKETLMYDPLVKLVNHSTAGPFPESLESLRFKRLTMRNTSQVPDPESPEYKRWRPDISTTIRDLEESKDPSFFNQLLPFELKAGDHDPFIDPEPDVTGEARLEHQFQCPTAESAETRGQIVAHLTEMFARRFRTHAFSVYMNHHTARFIRADRCAILVTESFNYRSRSDILWEFLARFTRLEESKWGIDLTVDASSAEDCNIGVGNLKNLPPTPKHRVGMTHGMRWFIIQVPQEDGEGTRSVIAREPVRDPEALISRGTRTFAVHDSMMGKNFFLKDGWRADLDGMEKEPDILRELQKAGVPHIPHFEDGGDLDGESHATISHLFKDKPWRAGPLHELVPRRHYRFLEDLVSRDLDKFETPKQLVQALADAFEAHRQAYEKCQIIHRDVSEKNIMIGPEGRGVLVDWEFAKKVGSPGGEGLEPKGKRHVNRTGTWYFMSALLLGTENKEHTIQDDMESFFWILLYNGLYNLPHNCEEDTKDIVESVFKELRRTKHGYQGGLGKTALITISRFIGREFAFIDNGPLSTLLQTFRAALREYYIWYSDDEKAQLSPEAFMDAIMHHVPKNMMLRNHDHVRQLFNSTLEADGWTNNRKPPKTNEGPGSDTRTSTRNTPGEDSEGSRKPKRQRTSGSAPKAGPSSMRERRHRGSGGSKSKSRG